MYPLSQIAVPKLPEGYLETLPAPARQAVTRKREQVNLADDLAHRAIQAYYASITFADAQVGRILDTLEETGLAEETIVLFTSDHGYHMGEHGHWQKTTLFENATRVPLIISVPGMKLAGSGTPAPAEMVDFYPTLAELCGLPAPRYLSGVSLAPVLENPAARPRQSALTQYADGYSIRTARYRYTEWGADGREGAELYDHESDPEELLNLSRRPEQGETMRRLSKLLRQRINAAGTPPEGVEQIRFDNRRRVP
jgi:arylsulfatase A-like enzyme